MDTEDRLIFLAITLLCLSFVGAIILGVTAARPGDARAHLPLSQVLRPMFSRLSGWRRLGIVLTLVWAAFIGAVFIGESLSREEFLAMLILWPALAWAGIFFGAKLVRWVYRGFQGGEAEIALAGTVAALPAKSLHALSTMPRFLVVILAGSVCANIVLGSISFSAYQRAKATNRAATLLGISLRVADRGAENAREAINTYAEGTASCRNTVTELQIYSKQVSNGIADAKLELLQIRSASDFGSSGRKRIYGDSLAD